MTDELAAQGGTSGTSTEGLALGFVDRLPAVCSRVLGDAVASVILHGSLALDDYAPERSNIDLLVIADGPLSGEVTWPSDSSKRTVRGTPKSVSAVG